MPVCHGRPRTTGQPVNNGKEFFDVSRDEVEEAVAAVVSVEFILTAVAEECRESLAQRERAKQAAEKAAAATTAQPKFSPRGLDLKSFEGRSEQSEWLETRCNDAA